MPEDENEWEEMDDAGKLEGRRKDKGTIQYLAAQLQKYKEKASRKRKKKRAPAESTHGLILDTSERLETKQKEQDDIVKLAEGKVVRKQAADTKKEAKVAAAKAAAEKKATDLVAKEAKLRADYKEVSAKVGKSKAKINSLQVGELKVFIQSREGIRKTQWKARDGDKKPMGHAALKALAAKVWDEPLHPVLNESPNQRPRQRRKPEEQPELDAGTEGNLAAAMDGAAGGGGGGSDESISSSSSDDDDDEGDYSDASSD